MLPKSWSSLLLLSTLVAACGGGGASGAGPGDGGSPNGMDGSASGDAGPGDAATEAAVDAPVDTTPPTFAGATSARALGQSAITVGWSSATDDLTPANVIAYRVYMGIAAGAEDFKAPAVTSPAGATAVVVEQLLASTSYYFVVRAVDLAGNEDSNDVEVTAKTPDTSPPAFAGAQAVTGTSASTALVTWSAASDNASTADAIHYDVYVTTTQGAEDFSTPSLVTAPGATSATLTGLSEAAAVYVVVRAVDLDGNEDGNDHEVTGATLDTTPPTFSGLSGAVATGTTIALTWTRATDPYVAPSTLVYDVYVATTSGQENFATPSFTTPAGASGFSLSNLALVTTYYVVVRARDAYGNEDTNTIEQSATTQNTAPPAFAGLTSATATSPTSVDLTWTNATETGTSDQEFVYYVYGGGGSLLEDFSSPLTTSTGDRAGAITLSVTATAGTTHCYVVRAKNVAGVLDTNTVEQCATTGAQPPSIAGSVACDAAATSALPSYVSVSFPAATAGSYPVASYQICTTLSSSGGCSPFTPTATARTATGETLVGAPANGAGTLTNGGPLLSFQSYDVYVRALDTNGNPSTAISTGAAPCATAPSYTSDVLAYVTPSCNSAGCHANGTLPGPFDLSYWQGNTPPNLCADGGSPSPFVVPGDSAGSLLYQSVAGAYVGCTGVPQMPLGAPKNTAWGRGTNETMIEEWIDDGAGAD